MSFYWVEPSMYGFAIMYREPEAESGKACIGGTASERLANLRCKILNQHLENYRMTPELRQVMENNNMRPKP